MGKRAYLVQKTIPLAKYQGSPYDIRVSVQRAGSGTWEITGMVGKVAGKGRHLTNVARGGKVKRCRTLFKSSGFHMGAAERSISRLSLDIAKHLSTKLHRLADVGLDIGLDKSGKAHFIEMNGRDQRYSFKKARLSKTFYKTYENPLKYARYLLKKNHMLEHRTVL